MYHFLPKLNQGGDAGEVSFILTHFYIGSIGVVSCDFEDFVHDFPATWNMPK